MFRRPKPATPENNPVNVDQRRPDAQNTEVLVADDMRITYGAVTAVAGLSLRVTRGEVVGLLGGNGAGKSSTLRAVAGVNPHTSGHLVVAGHDMSTSLGAERARARVGYCPDVGGVLRQATVREHIGLALAFRNRLDLWPHALTLVEQFGLTHVLDRVTHGFSHGMTRRLSVLLAVLTAVDLLILDEPFDGVDPIGVDATLHAIAAARQAGLGVLVSTHLLELVVASSDRIEVLAGGRVRESAPVAMFTGDHGKARYEQVLRTAAPPSPKAPNPTQGSQQ